jgi:hypothetical protein
LLAHVVFGKPVPLDQVEGMLLRDRR